jgi:hypothetical protein
MELAAKVVSDANAADIAGAAESVVVVVVVAAAAVVVVSADGAPETVNAVDVDVAESVAVVSGTHVAVMARAAVAAGDAEDSTRTQRNKTNPPLQAQNEAERSSCNRRIQQSQNIRDG